MNQDLLNEVKKIKDELHGSLPSDPSRLFDFAKKIQAPRTDVIFAFLKVFGPSVGKAFGDSVGRYYVPNLLLQVVEKILAGRKAKVVGDPWAGVGAMLATALEATHAEQAFAFTPNKTEAGLGAIWAESAKWSVGHPITLLDTLKTDIDVVVSVLPFNAKTGRKIILNQLNGNEVEIKSDLGESILVSSAAHLSADGVGLFVVSPSFFLSERSVLRQFNNLGLGVQAALALPSGSFAPYTNMQTYLLIVKKRAHPRMFVAQLSDDATTNAQIISNLKEEKEGGTLELGRFVDPLSFKGLGAIRIEERFRVAEREYGAPALRLAELATSINLGRPGEGFRFNEHENAIFVPLLGWNQVVVSTDELELKPQDYAQVVIDPKRSNSRFVAQFLNSNLGVGAREQGIIPRLNKRTLKSLRVFVPDLKTQNTLLAIEDRIVAENNTLSGLWIELAELQRELWANPRSAPGIDKQVAAFSNRLSGGLKQQAMAGLEQWFETLPFPLASILRAWQATPSHDFKTKHEHMLHFFEATAEFISVIFLSAYGSTEAVFEAYKQKLLDSMQKQKLSFRRATFGTWKFIIEYLGSQTRDLLSGDKDAHALCAEIFSDPTMALPTMLSKKELAAIISTTNKMRNDWSGHGGVVGQDEARSRNEQLLTQLQSLREVMADTWADIQLINALNCKLRRGVCENEVAILMGSNSEFLKETRSMATHLDVELLYLSRTGFGGALKLLPLVQVGPSPESAKNACYFFSRMEGDSARFISYHYSDRPELTSKFDEATDVIKFLTEA